MSALELQPAQSCRWDLVALGEVMLRLDPGDGRIATTRNFRVWEGGGEYNVARGLRRCFGMRTAIVTALPDNPVGRLVEDLMLQGGVETSHVRWTRFDGIGRESRVGLNFVERGFGVRAALGCSDRANSAASKLAPGAIDWDDLFDRERTRWLHTGGVFCGLSDTTPAVAAEAMAAAHRHGVIVSYDLNFRPSLWASSGGMDRAQDVNRRLMKDVDVLFGNEEDFSTALGFNVGDAPGSMDRLDPAAYARMIAQVVQAYPNLRVVASTLRVARTASRNDWGAVCWSDGAVCEATLRPDLEIFDRVGGGDSFASGLIYGLLCGEGPQQAVEYGAAHGALAMTTPGDTSMATLSDVRRVMAGGGARVDR